MTTPWPDPLPLAAASVRLRGKPGRDSTPGDGHSAGTPVSQPPAATGPPRPAKDRASSAPRLPRRLIGLEEAAELLAISPWTVRELTWRGALPVVRLPRVRRLLFDLADVHALIEASKRGG